MIISIEFRKIFFVIPNTIQLGRQLIFPAMKTRSSRPILFQVKNFTNHLIVTVVNTFIIQLNFLTEVINLFLWLSKQDNGIISLVQQRKDRCQDL